MSPGRKPIVKKGKPQQKTKEIAAPKPRVHRVLLAWVLGIATILGATGILFLQPRPSVSPSSSPDLTDPFLASFTVTNTNIVPLRNVGVAVGVVDIDMRNDRYYEYDRPQIHPKHMSKFTREAWNYHDLDMDEKFTITPDVYRIPPGIVMFGGADIAILVTYRPWLLPIERERAFRFVTHNNGDGTFSWHSYPVK